MVGMREGKGSSMQRHLCDSIAFLSILRIAGDGMSSLSKMDTDLVLPPGQ